MVDLKKLLAAAALVTVLAAPAFAHTAFMKPNDFYPAADRVVVQSAWATQFFTAAIGLGQQSFKVIGPDGGASSFIGFDVSAQDAHLEAIGRAHV